MRTSILPLLLLSVACSKKPQTALIHGHVYLQTRVGEIRRGAAAPVGLLSTASSYRQAWRALCDSQDVAFRAKTRADSILVDREKDPSRAIRLLEAQQISIIEGARHDRDVRYASLLDLSEAPGRTDIDGAFRFESVPPGRYWLFSGMELMDHPYGWFVPIAVVAGESLTVDLSTANVLPAIFNCDDDLPAR